MSFQQPFFSVSSPSTLPAPIFSCHSLSPARMPCRTDADYEATNDSNAAFDASAFFIDLSEDETFVPPA